MVRVSRPGWSVAVFLLLVSGLSGCDRLEQRVTGLHGDSAIASGDGSVVLPALVAGEHHTCAALGGRVTCWGRNNQGQTAVPAGLGSVVALTAGWSHTCALTAAGRVICWGWDGYGQASPPSSLPPVRALGAGRVHTCAVTAGEGRVVCWGRNTAGQAEPPSLTGALAVAGGTNHTCAIVDQRVACWGDDELGQSSPPVGLSNPVSIAAGIGISCVIHDPGIRCWGRDSQLSEGQRSPDAVRLAMRMGGLCALVSNGVRCWGPPWLRRVPDAVGGDVDAVAVGAEHACALRQTGRAVCWGDNRHGQATPPSALRPE